MKIIFTEHASAKLQRLDIKNFKVDKNKLKAAILFPDYTGKTKTGELVAIVNLNTVYVLRVIYIKIGVEIKLITFHTSRKGRYGT